MSTEVGKLYVQFDADGRPYIQGLKDIDRRTKAFQRDQQTAFDKLGNKLGSAIKLGMAAGAAAVVAGGTLITKSLIKTAASYEYEMSRIKAVTSATDTEMRALSATALQLGKDTQFSAGEAAQGINELAKAGVSVADILGGGISGTLAPGCCWRTGSGGRGRSRLQRHEHLRPDRQRRGYGGRYPGRRGQRLLP